MLALATGITDVVTLSDYHVSASNQTRNTTLLAVSALDLGSVIIKMQHVGLSLEASIADGLIRGQLSNWIGCTRRIWLLATNVLQTALVQTQNLDPARFLDGISCNDGAILFGGHHEVYSESYIRRFSPQFQTQQ